LRNVRSEYSLGECGFQNGI